MRIIKVETIAIQQKSSKGKLRKLASLYIQVPYSGNGWNIGCWSIPHSDIFSVRSMFKAVPYSQV